MTTTMMRRITILVLLGSGVLIAGMWAWDPFWLGTGGWQFDIWHFHVSASGYALSLLVGEPIRGAAYHQDFVLFSFARGPGWWHLVFPYWLPLLIVLMYPLIRLVRVRWRGRRRDDRWLADACVSCGYSLEGLMSAACPECGERCGGYNPTIRGVWRRQALDYTLLFFLLGLVQSATILTWIWGVACFVDEPFWPPGRIAEKLLADAVSFIGYGLFRGVMLTTIAVPLLFRKPVRRVFWSLAFATILVTCMELFALTVLVDISPVIGTPLPILVFAIMCILLRRKLPNVHMPGRCAHCEIDLTGNESGVRPECGKEIVDREVGGSVPSG